MMKTRVFILILTLAAAMTACRKTESIVPVGVNSNFFAGVYNPANRVQALSCSEHVVGVECGDYELPDCVQMNWHWSPQHLDSIEVYDSRINTPGPLTARYYYDPAGRLSRVESDYTVLNHAYDLQYEGSHLVSIAETYGGRHTDYTFGYDGADYPISLTRHAQGQYAELTDTYTLRWREGNLVAAVCGPDNNAYAIDSITYTYSNHDNPFCGLLSPYFFRQYSIVDAPLFFSKNIPVSITYHTDNGPMQDVYYTLQYECTDGVPTQIAHRYSNMYWCDYTDTYSLRY